MTRVPGLTAKRGIALSGLRSDAGRGVVQNGASGTWEGSSQRPIGSWRGRFDRLARAPKAGGRRGRSMLA